MNRNMRTYYYAILGALGGLIAWQLSNYLGLSFTGAFYINVAIVGGLVGLIVGLFIGIAEGLLTRNWFQALRSGLLSALAGILAGAVGLTVGEFLFEAVGAGEIGRTLGWALFGLLIGLAEGLLGRAEVWKPAVGGLIGGAVGGLLLELIGVRFALDVVTGKVVGLVLMGALVGLFISLISVALSRAWLEVTSGKLKGTEFILDKFMHKGFPSVAIGSSPLKSEIVLPDPDIAPQHAMLSGNGMAFSLKDMSLAGTYINGKKIEQIQLTNGQKIRMGNTEMVYHEKR